MKDYIVKAIAANGYVRAYVATTKDTVEQARIYHDTLPVASAALGRLLTATAIMGSMLKGDKDLVTMQIKGDGPLKGALATADSSARVKGYVYNSKVEIPLKETAKLDVGSAIGEGVLTITKDSGLKEPYSGQVELISGEIAEDIAYYYTKSEQLPSAVALGVLVDTDISIKCAGGFIIQVMPGADDEVISMIENNVSKLPSITKLLEDGETPETILGMIFGDENLIISEKVPVEYYCNCSRQRVEKALISIGFSDLEDILVNDKQAKLHCHFCGKEYEFNERDLQDLIEYAKV